jgi:N-acetylglucosaminyldiphosphoundecaprenol N-acetyl-beta-D-mannosaminyltransferase
MQRVPGIELAEKLLAGAAPEGLRVYFLGGAPGVAQSASQAMTERYAGLVVAGSHHGYFSPAEESEVVAKVAEARADVLLVAMGAPRQEMFLERHRTELGVSVSLGVGGSFDVWAGNVSRAPEPVRRLGVEWAYRLLTDPRRLRRQLVLPEFVWHVIRGLGDNYGAMRAANGLWRAGWQEDDEQASPEGR